MAEQPYTPTYSASRALLVGIDSYQDQRFVPLGKAEDDAYNCPNYLQARRTTST